MKFTHRIGRDMLFMNIAELVALRSTCNRARVGAVIVKNRRVVSMGYCGAPSGIPHCTEVGCEIVYDGCERTSHAEANAIAFAARVGIALEDGTMYCTHAPCYTCAKLIINAGIKVLCFLKQYRDVRGLELLREAGVRVHEFDYKLEDTMEQYKR